MIDHELTDPAGGALTITHDHQGVWVTATEGRDEVTVGPFPARTLRESFDMSGDLMDGGVTCGQTENEVDGRAMWEKARTDHLTPERARSLVQENTELRSRIGRVEEARDLYRHDVMTAERREQEFADRTEKAEQERDSVQAAMSRAIEENLRLRTENPRPEKYDAHAEAAEKVGALLRARTVDLVEALAERDKARRERDHACKSLKESDAALREMRETPRPLTADDITDEMVKRGAERFRGLPTAMSAHARVRTIIRAALTPPPSRPEGAEGVDEVLRTFPGTLAGIRDISDHLASHGVRAGGDS